MIKYCKNWQPTNEYNNITDEDFDKRFEIDRMFNYETLFWKYRIRFVRYPDNDNISVFVYGLRKPTSFFIEPLGRNMNIAKYLSGLVTKQSTYELSLNEVHDKFGYEIKTKSDHRDEKIESILD